jgi:hypothetical protein
MRRRGTLAALLAALFAGEPLLAHWTHLVMSYQCTPERVNLSKAIQNLYPNIARWLPSECAEARQRLIRASKQRPLPAPDE